MEKSNDASLSLLAFAGSLRAESYNRSLVRAAQELAPDGVHIDHYLLGDLPFFNQDVEEQGDPPVVRDFKNKIRRADGVLIATPEYQYSVPGVLKNALDWASRPPRDAPLKGKPVAIMGASPGMVGTARAHMHLRQVLAYNEVRMVLRPEVLVARAGDKFDDDGDLVDEGGRRFLGQLLEALVAKVHETRAAR